MAGIIKPNKGQYGENDLPMTTGWHVVQCESVDDLPPSDKYRNPKPRLCFVFRKYNANLNCLYPDKAVAVMTASVFLGTPSMKPSQLVQWAKQVGYRGIENGINPQAWVGRFFTAFVRNIGKTAWVELHSPCGEPNGETPEDREAWEQLVIESCPLRGQESAESADLTNNPPF